MGFNDEPGPKRFTFSFGFARKHQLVAENLGQQSEEDDNQALLHLESLLLRFFLRANQSRFVIIK